MPGIGQYSVSCINPISFFIDNKKMDSEEALSIKLVQNKTSWYDRWLEIGNWIQ